MEYCCIRACRSYGIPHDKSDLFPLPTSLQERSLWIRAFGISTSDINDSFRVCGAHFRRKYFLGDKPELERNSSTCQTFEEGMKFPEGTSGQKTFLILTPQGEAIPILAPNAEALKIAVPQLNVLPPNSVNFSLSDGSIVTPPSSQPIGNAKTVYKLTANHLSVAPQSVCSIVQVQSLNPSSGDKAATEPLFNISEGCSKSVETSCNASTSSEVPDSVALNLECEEDTLTLAQRNAQLNKFSSSEASVLLQNLSRQYTSDALSSKGNLKNISLISSPKSVFQTSAPSNSLTTVQLSIKEVASTNSKSIPVKISVVPMKLEESQKYVPDQNLGSKKVDEEILPIGLGTRKNSTEKSLQASESTQILISDAISVRSEGLEEKKDVSDKSMESNVQAETDMKSALPKSLPPKEVCTNSENSEEVALVSDKRETADKEQAKQDDVDTSSSGTSLTQKEMVEGSESEKELETKSDPEGETSSENSPVLIELVLSDEDEAEVVKNKSKCDPKREEAMVELEKVKEDLKQQAQQIRDILEGNGKPPGFQQDAASASSKQVDKDSAVKVNAVLNSNDLPLEIIIKDDRNRGEASTSRSEKQMERKETEESKRLQAIQKQKALQKVVTEFTIRFLQDTIPILPSGRKPVSMEALLQVKTYGTLSYSKEEALSLRFRLREENCVLGCILWLAERGYIPKAVKCSTCGDTCVLRRERNIADGWCYPCDKCNLKFEVKRNKVWQSFSNYSLEELMLLTYHWACQSDISEIQKDVNLSLEKIFLYYTALQNFCFGIITRKIKSKTLVKKIEVAFVRFHSQCIVGAYDRSNDLYYLEVIRVDQIETDKYIEVLEKWQVNKNIIITQKKICYWLTKFYTFCSTTNLNDNADHLMKFLLTNLEGLFGELQHRNLHYRVLQGFLNDFQWRQRYGKYLELSFWNIIQQLFLSSNFPVGVFKSLNSLIEQRTPNEIYSEEFLERWGPFKKPGDMEVMKTFNYFGIQDSPPVEKEKLENDEISVVAVVENNSVKQQNSSQTLNTSDKRKENVLDLSTVLKSIQNMLGYNVELNQENELKLQKVKINTVQISSSVPASSTSTLSAPVAPSLPSMPSLAALGSGKNIQVSGTYKAPAPTPTIVSASSILNVSYTPNLLAPAALLKAPMTYIPLLSSLNLAQPLQLPVSNVTILPPAACAPSNPIKMAYVPPATLPAPSSTAVFPPNTTAASSSVSTGGSKSAPIPSTPAVPVKRNPESQSIQVLKQSSSVEILGSDIAQLPMNLMDFLNIEDDDDGASPVSINKNETVRRKPKPSIFVDVISADDESEKKKTFSTYSNMTPKVSSNLSTSDPQSDQAKVPSIFHLQHLIPIIPSGSRGVSPLALLSVKSHIYPARQQEASFLRVKLREEHFVAGYIQWLVRHHHLPPVPTCAFCSSKNFSVFRDKKCFEGYIYRCENKTCFNQEPVKRPRFFDKFMFLTLRELLLLTYHWACQSDYEEIMKDVPIDLTQINVYFQSLRELCGKILSKKGCLGGIRSPSRIEAAVVKLGKVYILGAYDRSNGHTRLHALSHDEALNSDKHIKLLRNWIHSENILITERKLEELNNIYSVEVNRAITNINDSGYHIFTVTKYLGRKLTKMFGSFNHDELPKEVIQGFLDELQWREMYGMFLEMAFWNIFNHMRFENPSPDSVAIDTRNLPLEIAFESKLLRDRWGPLRASDKGILIQPNTLTPRKPESVIKASAESSNLEKRDKRLDLAVKKLPSILSKKSSSASRAAKNVDDPATCLTFGGTSGSTPEVDFSKVSVDNAHSLVGVKIYFEETTTNSAKYELDCNKLGLKLKQDGFLSEPVKWMVRKGLIKSEYPCYVCKGPSRLKNNSKFVDGCSQICTDEKCRFENKFRRPFFLASFGFSLSNILAVIYHWAVQTDPRVILSVIHLDIYKILCVRRRIQDICAAIVRQCSSKLGNSGEIVEVSFAEYKTFFILGAYERKTQCSYLGAFPNFSTLELKKLQILLQSWIHRNSTVVVPSKELYEALVKSFANVALADRSIVKRNHPGYHVMNIINYFQKNISYAFHEIEDKILTADVVQKYLYEFMWRERYGRTPEAAFWRIMKEICSYVVKDWPTNYKSRQKPQNASSSNSEEAGAFEPTLFDPDVVEKCLQNNMNIKSSKRTSYDSSSSGDDSNHGFFENDPVSELQAYEKFLSSRHAALNSEQKDSLSKGNEVEISERGGKSTPGHMSKKFKASTDMQTTFVLSEDVQELPYLPEYRVVLSRIPEDILQLHLSGVSSSLGLETHPDKESEVKECPEVSQDMLSASNLLKKLSKMVEKDRQLESSVSSIVVTSASALETLLEKESCEKETPETPWETYKASYMLKNLSKMAEKNQTPAPPVNTLGSIKIQSVISQGVVHTDAIQTVKSPTKDALSTWWKDGLSSASVPKKPSSGTDGNQLTQKDASTVESSSVDVKPDVSLIETDVKLETNKQSPVVKVSDKDSSISQVDDSSEDISIIETLPQSESEKGSSTQKHVDEICLDSDPEDSKPDVSLLKSSVQSEIKKKATESTSDAETSLKLKRKYTPTPTVGNVSPSEIPIKKEGPIPTNTASSSSNLKHSDRPGTLKRKPVIQLRIVKEISEKGVQGSSYKSELKEDSSSDVSDPEYIVKKEAKRGKLVQKAAVKSSVKLKKPIKGSKKAQKRKFASIEEYVEIPIHTYSRAHKKKSLVYSFPDEGSVKNDPSEDNAVASSSTSMELLDTDSYKFKCIECAEMVDSSHFDKQFYCSDCKKTVFTTNCPKSFFEHRSRILFGKRMPLIRKQILWHKKPVVVEDDWYCYCGFKTKLGNTIASHILKCNTITCYKPAWMT